MLLKIFSLCCVSMICWAETVSVIVPCYYKHFDLLPELLHHISLQTVLPEEVVISVSEEGKIDVDQRKKIESLKYPFKVNYIFHKERRYAGDNRNCACEKAIGDIFITQDADDIPHPQRVEIIKSMFQKYDVVHIVHKFAYPYLRKGGSFGAEFSINKIKTSLMTHDYMTECWVFGPLTNGEMAIRREVFDKLHWSTQRVGEDVDFNCRVVALFKKSLILNAELLLYRQHFSSNTSRAIRDQLTQRYTE